MLSIRVRFFYFILVALLLGWCYLRARAGGDFDVFLHAAAKLSHGENPYRPPFINDGLRYYYSPVFAWALQFPARLPWWIPELVWLVFSLGCLARSWVLIAKSLDQNALSRRQYAYWLGGSLLIAFRFINDNMHMIQMTFFLLWVCLEAGLSSRESGKRRDLAAGALLGLGIAIKTMPALFVPYLCYRGRWRAALAAVAAVIVLLLLPAAFIGWPQNLFLLGEWWAVINPANAEHSIETEPGLHSLTAFLPVYLTETTGEVPLRRHLAELGPQAAVLITNLARLALAVPALVLLGWPPFTDRVSPAQRLREVAYVCLCVPLFFPHQQKYAFLFVLPGVAYVLYWLLAHRQSGHLRRAVFILAAALLALTVDTFLGWPGYRVAQHFRVMTVGALLLIPLLLVCRPDRLPHR